MEVIGCLNYSLKASYANKVMKDLGLTSFALLQCLTETMICVSGGEQLKVLREFLDKMEQLQPEAAAAATCP